MNDNKQSKQLKEEFEPAEVEVIVFATEDVITASTVKRMKGIEDCFSSPDDISFLYE